MPKNKKEGVDLDGEIINFEEGFEEFLKDNPIEEVGEKSKSFDLDSLPTDFSVNTGQSIVYEPLKAGVYQVEILKVEIKENFFYKPNEKDPSKRGNKYQVSPTFVVLNPGENYGRRLWDNMAPVIKPSGKRGATKLYKMVTSALNSEMSWDDCEGFASDNTKFAENLKGLIGKQLQVTVEVATSESGKKRNKIISYFPVDTNLPKFDETKVKK